MECHCIDLYVLKVTLRLIIYLINKINITKYGFFKENSHNFSKFFLIVVFDWELELERVRQQSQLCYSDAHCL